MPSQLHEALALLFRECPYLGVVLARDVLGVSLPDEVTVAAVSAEFADLDPAEYRADVVLRIDGPDGQARDVFIIEVQLQVDPEKSYSWHLYAAGARKRFRCPATVVVVTPNARVARKAAQPVDVDRAGNQFRPLVLGPETVPVVIEKDVAQALPELAVLSAIMHANEQGAEAVAAAGLEACRALDDSRQGIYADIIFDSLGDVARAALEKLMDLRGYQFPQSDYFKKKLQEEVEKEVQKELQKQYNDGRYDGQRDLLKRQLARKFGNLPSGLIQRIDDAQPGDLQQWSDRFVDVSSLEEVFAADS